MKSTREQILAILTTRQAVTAGELARMLHLTTANIRHHLKKLEQDDRITGVGTRPSTGRGRPTRLYTLSRQGENLDRLAGILLEELFDGLSPPEQSARLRAIASRLSGGGADPNQHITQRLYHAIRRLNELSYQARWEARANAPQVILGHCPYMDIISDHPELCQIDAYLLGELLGEGVRQTAKLTQNRQGLRVCVFAVI